MSSLRNAIPQRPYRERDQPQSRQKLGLLEKHKDYRLRAKSHNEKKAKIRALTAKAKDRNPDEFSFRMMSSKQNSKTGTREGKRRDDNGPGSGSAMRHETVQLLKTQDAGYLRTARNRVRRELERLKEEWGVVEKGMADPSNGALDVVGDIGKRNRHMVFVEDESQQNSFDAAEWFGTDESGLSRAYNRPRRQTMAASEQSEETKSITATRQVERNPDNVKQAFKDKRRASEKREKELAMRKAKLSSLGQQEKELAIAERELDLQRARMSNSIGGVNKNGIKFKIRERKK